MAANSLLDRCRPTDKTGPLATLRCGPLAERRSKDERLGTASFAGGVAAEEGDAAPEEVAAMAVGR
jgi:hypothetical protein